MKIKPKNIEFLTFNDGTIRLFETDDDEKPIPETERDYRFGNRTIGVKRYYAARELDVELTKVIHIHQNTALDTSFTAVIGDTCYKIEQIQHLSDTNPRCTVLSLSQRGLYQGGFDNEL